MKRFMAGVVGAALLLTACSSGGTAGGSGSTQSAETLTTAIGFDVDTLDPAAQVTTNVMQLLKMGVETFTKMEPDGKISPSLATGWTTSTSRIGTTS